MSETKNIGPSSKYTAENFNQLKVKQRTGKEPFHNGGQPVNFDLGSFWQWSSSDIVNNRTRGILAEYLVAQAIGVADGSVREEWAPRDLKTQDG